MEASQDSDAWAAGAGLGAWGMKRVLGEGCGGGVRSWPGGPGLSPLNELHQWNLTELALPLQLLNKPNKKVCSPLRVSSSGTQANVLLMSHKWWGRHAFLFSAEVRRCTLTFAWGFRARAHWLLWHGDWLFQESSFYFSNFPPPFVSILLNICMKYYH